MELPLKYLLFHEWLILDFPRAMLRTYGTQTQENTGRGCSRESHRLGQPGLYRLGDRAACARIESGALVPVFAGHPVYAGGLHNRLLSDERGQMILTLTSTVIGDQRHFSSRTCIKQFIIVS